MITQSAESKISRQSRASKAAGRISETQKYYQALLRSLPLSGTGAEYPIRTLGITSSTRGEGVSTVATFVAREAASAGMKVLLVDANFNQPAIHNIFGAAHTPGLTETLAGDADFETPVQASGIDNLFLLTNGASGVHFNTSIMTEKLTALIRSLESEYDLILFDLQESLPGGVTISLSSLLQGVILVVEAERIRWKVAARAKELLLSSGANILGTVMNRRKQRIPRWLCCNW